MLEIGRNQRVLGRKVVVERTLADADLGGNRVDADGADALQVEQPVGSLKDAILHRLFLVRRSHALAPYLTRLTPPPPYSQSTQVCVTKNRVNRRWTFCAAIDRENKTNALAAGPASHASHPDRRLRHAHPEHGS